MRRVPLMTWPTPIWTTKSPRPGLSDSSNLVKGQRKRQSGSVKRDELGALVARLGGVLEETLVVNGDGLAGGRHGAAALGDSGLGDTHCDRSAVCCVEFVIEGGRGRWGSDWAEAGGGEELGFMGWQSTAQYV